MPGAPLIEQVGPDSSTRDVAGVISQLPAGGKELGMG